jgi:hypothetical protein
MTYSLKDDKTKELVFSLDQEGLTQKEIGCKLDIPSSTIGDLLRGETFVGWHQQRLQITSNFDHTPTVHKAYKQGEDGVWSIGNRILVISDTHFPYHHEDTFKFLSWVKGYWGIDGAVSVGDMNDNHFPSYHEKEWDCYSGKDEIKYSREACKELEEIFPELLISTGNHDLLPKRKAQSADIPLDWVAHPNNIYGLKGGWEWGSHHYFKVGDNKCLLVHSVSANTRNNATKYSYCSVQGHHHSEFCVAYTSDTDLLRWSMSVGCLIDPRAPAFRYDKNNIVKRPILGCGVILDGVPYTVPMMLNSKGRWIGA